MRASASDAAPSPDVSFAAYEHAVFGPELDRLRTLQQSTNRVVRSAAGTVLELLLARARIRAEAVGGADPGGFDPVEPGPLGKGGETPVPLGQDVAAHPFWSLSMEVDGPRHETFLHDARVEFRRLGLDEEGDAYRTVFLLEAVDEIDMLAALAMEGAPRMGEFPTEVTASEAPATQDPSLYAAWLHRQVTLRMLRRMGVPVDARFEHVLLNAGLGAGLTPYAARAR